MIVLTYFFYVTSMKNYLCSHSCTLPRIFLVFYYHKAFRIYLQVDKLAFQAYFAYNSSQFCR